MKKLLLALLCLLPITAQAQTRLNKYQPGYRLIDGSQLNKAVDAINDIQGNGTARFIAASKIITTNTPPVATVCGTSPVVAGSRTAGLVTMGTGSPTGCVLTFASAFTNTPFCVVTWQTNLASMQYTVTNAALTLVQTGTSSNLVNWHCMATSGG